MSTLRRSLAPIDEQEWAAIDEHARSAMQRALAARKFVDFTGPLGWDRSGIGLGRVRPIDGPVPDVEARVRTLQPLVEYRAPFVLSRAEVDCISRGAEDADLDAVVEAAMRAALAEDTVVFYGLANGSVSGIWGSAGEPISLSEDYRSYPKAVTEALERMQLAGVDGPYGIALGNRCWQGLLQTVNEGGYPLLDVVRNLLDGPIAWAPALDGALVLSLRGGDFRLTVGRDWSVGYLGHDDDSIRLYIEQSFTFHVNEGTAAVPLAHAHEPGGSRRRRKPG